MAPHHLLARERYRGRDGSFGRRIRHELKKGQIVAVPVANASHRSTVRVSRRSSVANVMRHELKYFYQRPIASGFRAREEGLGETS